MFNVGYFEHEDEGGDEEWSMRFENEKGEAMEVYFLTMLLTNEDQETKQSDETVPMRELLDSQKSLEESCPEDRVDRRYPRSEKKNPKHSILPSTKCRKRRVLEFDHLNLLSL